MDNEKEAVETPAPDAATEQEKEVETKADDTATETKEETQEDASTQKTNEIDYKAELERIKEERDNYKTGLLNAKKELKESKKSDAEEVVDDAVNESGGYITAEEFEKRIEAKYKAEMEQNMNAFKIEMAQATIEEELGKVSANSDEAALIKFHYENTIRQSGFTRSAISQDLKRAKLLANEKRLQIENEELKEALKAKNSMGNASRGSNQDRKEPVHITQEDRRIADRFFNGDVKRYLKVKPK